MLVPQCGKASQVAPEPVELRGVQWPPMFVCFFSFWNISFIRVELWIKQGEPSVNVRRLRRVTSGKDGINFR